MDNVKNFAIATVSTGYNDAATAIVLATGHGAKLPAAPFRATWWNSGDYSNPADDPSAEIIRATAKSGDTLTIERAYEGPNPASAKDTAGKTYKLSVEFTEGDRQDLIDLIGTKADSSVVAALEAEVDLKALDSDLDALATSTASGLAGKANISHQHDGSDLATGTVPLAKLQNVATNKILGRLTSGSGPLQEITVGNGLRFTEGELRVLQEQIFGTYNVRDNTISNLVGDGTTDDSVALQSLINGVGAARGGTIYFPDDGPYIIAGALQDGARQNAQLLLPVVVPFEGMALGDQQYTITFLGYQPPACSPSGPLEVILPYGARIKSTLAAGSGTSPAVIGGKGPVGGLYGEVNYLNVKFENLIFETVANPSYSCLNMLCFTTVSFQECIIAAGNTMSVAEVVEPTTATSYGVIFPQVSSGIIQKVTGQLNVFGFYTGIKVGELLQADYLGVWGCKRGLEVPFSYHASLIHRYLCFWTPTGAVWTDEHCVDIQQWDSERAPSGSWYSPLVEISDPSNYARGEIKWITVLANVGRVHDFDVTGGSNLIVREIGVHSGPTSPPTLQSAEVGMVSAATVVATFSQEVKAPDYATGITIEIDDAPATISGATRQSSRAIVHYILSDPVLEGEDVTISYSAIDGFMTNEFGDHLADITEQEVVNHVGIGTILLHDTFTDTNGTPVTSHTMDVGGGWAAIEGTIHPPVVQSNKLQSVVYEAEAYAYIADAGAPDAEATCDFVIGALDGGHYCELLFRVFDANNYWTMRVSGLGSNNFQIVRKQSGVDNIEQQMTVALTAGVTYPFLVTCEGDDISCTLDGNVLNETNSFNSTTTKFGLRFYTYNAPFNTADNFMVTAL